MAISIRRDAAGAAIGRRAVLGLGAGAAAMLAGCGVPRGAPTRREVLRGASSADPEFAVYPVTRAFLPQVAAWPVVNPIPNEGWIAGGGGSRARVLAPGDTVAVAVWDADDNSLLTTPGQRVVALEGLRVSPSGTVFLPYVGDVRIGGLTEDRARAAVERSMADVIPAAQVQLTLEQGRASSADVVSGVGRPGSYPLDGGDRTVLSLIAEAGGVDRSLENPLVRLNRGGSTYLTTVERLYADPALDTTLRGGDRIVVIEDPRQFTAIGASGDEAAITFTEERMTAMDAVAALGGLLDTRADLKGVLVLREYPPEALGAGVRGPLNERVIFVLDLTSADGLFSARRFEVAPGDTVLVTESQVSTAESIIRVVTGGFGAARNARLVF